MKKSTEELILTQLLTINTEIGYIKMEMKDLRKEMGEGFKEVKSDIVEMKAEIKDIHLKLNWAGEKIFLDHENRLVALEGKFA